MNKFKEYPLPGEIYYHYKGGTYKVKHMATHSETQEKMVVYESLNFGSIHVRPIEKWFEPVIINDEEIIRFKNIK